MEKQYREGLVVKQPGPIVRTESGLSKMGYFLSRAEHVGVGAFSPLPQSFGVPE